MSSQILMPWGFKILRPYDVAIATSRALSVSYDDLLGRMRHRSIAQARHVAMYVARRQTKASFPEIGMAFRRDSSTVLCAVQKVEGLLPGDMYLRHCVWLVELELKRGTPGEEAKAACIKVSL